MLKLATYLAARFDCMLITNVSIHRTAAAKDHALDTCMRACKSQRRFARKVSQDIVNISMMRLGPK